MTDAETAILMAVARADLALCAWGPWLALGILTALTICIVLALTD